MKNTENHKSLNEFIEETLQAADQIIYDSFALLNEHDGAEEAYKKTDICQQFQIYLNRISEGFDYEAAQLSLLDAIQQNSYADFDVQAVEVNIKLFVDGEQTELFPSFRFGIKLGLLSSLTALYLGMAKYLMNKNEPVEVAKFTLKAGVALGKICGVHDEIQRKAMVIEHAYTAKKLHFKAELDRHQKAEQSKKARKKAAEDSTSKVKDEIKKYWEDWEEDPSLYKHLNRFVSVINKHFEKKIHIETVRRWIKEWSAEKYLKEQFELYFPSSYPHYDDFDRERFISDMVLACKKWGVKKPQIEIFYFQLVNKI